ncbi:MAG: UDP-N-acetylmuramoyl-L-alanyl-D-glutamate--2,6-diaminopimelate ligase [Candidatus Auribacterota bacterium]|nr:UDP-N-acetylmuramoyl-L-alanyl-D-glutamate--2,6-diaminopimelate ligase [Candidatus Auribacterota bacterium]
MIQLRSLLDSMTVKRIIGPADVMVAGIASDSRKVRKNFIYVAIPGKHYDGNDFIAEALVRGCSVVVGERFIDIMGECTFVEVPDVRRALAELAHTFYGKPSDKVTMIGITGTNGKTTVSHLIETMLQSIGCITGLLGTIEYRFTDYFYRANMTTPDAQFLNYILSKMVQENVDKVVMEVSSHALEQKRVDCIDFDIGVFTNLTSEHLDYHQTLENYLNCKTKLFTSMDFSKGDHRGAVINIDDPCGRYIAESMPKGSVTTYGIDTSADVRAIDIQLGKENLQFTVCCGDENERFNIPLIGRHNVYNSLAAIGVGYLLGMRLRDMKDGLASFGGVPGRLQRIPCAHPFSVYVDYAHTEDALRQVLQTLRSIHSGRMIVVFGCGGDRDALKRPVMGEIACKYADMSVLTSDNPRSEDPLKIISQIEKGFWNNSYHVIPNRKEAIQYAILQCRPDDVLLIAGKGHEKYQIIGNSVFPFDDVEVTRNFLLERKYVAV